jgi:hypothetical protein
MWCLQPPQKPKGMGKKAAPTPSFAKKAPVAAKATNPLYEKRAKSFGEWLWTCFRGLCTRLIHRMIAHPYIRPAPTTVLRPMVCRSHCVAVGSSLTGDDSLGASVARLPVGY